MGTTESFAFPKGLSEDCHFHIKKRSGKGAFCSNPNLERAELIDGILQVGNPRAEKQALLTCAVEVHGFHERHNDLGDFYRDILYNPTFKDYQHSGKKKKVSLAMFLKVTAKTHEGGKLARKFFFFFEGMKASYFYSFENPWSLTLNLNQEKFYLINNGIC